MTETKRLLNTVNAAILDALADLHTATIAKVTSVGETTISCQPVINRVVSGDSETLPEFIKVPPIFMHGGTSHESYPITVGDYCILFIMERCFDRWYDGQDNQPPAELRMHDYSDGFALVGIQNKAGAITIPDVITQIGDKYLEGNHEHVGDIDQTGDYTQTGAFDLTGDFTQTGSYDQDGDQSVTGNQEAASYSVGGTPGWSGSFATGDGRTATFVNGIITQVV